MPERTDVVTRSRSGAHRAVYLVAIAAVGVAVGLVAGSVVGFVVGVAARKSAGGTGDARDATSPGRESSGAGPSGSPFSRRTWTHRTSVRDSADPEGDGDRHQVARRRRRGARQRHGGGLPQPAGRHGYARHVDAGMDAEMAAETAAVTTTVTATVTDGRTDQVHHTVAGAASSTTTGAPAVATVATPTVTETTIDLAAIEADLADVEIALARLEAGTYWTCEVSGRPLPADLMASEPTRRRLPSV